MKTRIGYAIIERDGLALFDARLPIYWIKRVAKQVAKKRCIDYEIIKVEVKAAKVKDSK